MTPWFGLHLPNYTFPDASPAQLFDRVVEQVQAAEGAGFSTVTVMDHLYQIPGVGPVTEVLVRESRDRSVTLLFDPEHNLEERILIEQFTA